jgi:hypothetical protein
VEELNAGPPARGQASTRELGSNTPVSGGEVEEGLSGGIQLRLQRREGQVWYPAKELKELSA